MREEDKACIAGIIDGEGSMMLERIHKNQHPSPVVSVTSTTPELLKYLKTTLGFGTITKKTNYNKENINTVTLSVFVMILLLISLNIFILI